jgi:RND superfamily putative drug exporter
MPGVASVTPTVTSPNGKVLLATVYPTTSPQAQQTVNLVNELRGHLIPGAADGTSLAVHVGGVTATNIDFAHVLTDKLPIFIAIVVLLAFLLLMVAFRSLLIPLEASAMNLFSVAAALGAMNAARRNQLAVITGQAKSGPVIAAAASIMILVFGSFMFGGTRELAEFGFGLAFSVLVDALLIRSLLVPALMHLIGPANWALPGWLPNPVVRWEKATVNPEKGNVSA